MEPVKLMDRQILRAKLYVPRVRPDNVPRERLYGRLDRGVGRELTVVTAPAGFGKTTLLADWSRRTELPVAWVSLDERDDDPVRFLLYVISAIETIHEGFGESSRAFLASLPTQEELEPVLTALSNEILELGSDFVLVLDDYHAIRSETIHEALAFLLLCVSCSVVYFVVSFIFCSFLFLRSVFSSRAHLLLICYCCFVFCLP